MFGRKKQTDDKMPEIGDDLAIPAKPGGVRPPGAAPTPAPTRPPAPVGSRPIGADGPAKPGDSAKSAEGARPPLTPTPVKREAETRKLIVGREISLSGEITACDRLVVDIAESGLFKGSASIDDAEVRGRFEGTLNVRRRLLIRATGKVIGTVRYGQIEIECGGQISGEIQAQPMGEGMESTAATQRPTIVPVSEQAKA